MDDRLKKYPSTERFRVIDTIGVPHPYCITPKHVTIASDKFNGILGEDAIRAAEKTGARCDICKGKLPFDKHEIGVIVEVKSDGKRIQDVPGINEYLMSIKPLLVADGFAGCAFKEVK